MAIKGGFQGKILEVDLTSGTTKAAPLPSEDVLRTYGGATGLGLYLIAQGITPTTRADDPDCPFYLLTGPLTGVMVPNASHWVIVNIRTYPTYHVGLSHAHGYLGPDSSMPAGMASRSEAHRRPRSISGSTTTTSS